MCKVEKIEFDGVTYRRYPESKYNRHKRFHDYKGKSLHRAIWEYHKGKIPEGYHIHHKDGDPFNNSIENLQCLTPKDHCKAHSELAKVDPSKDIYESRRQWQKSKEGLEHHSRLAKDLWANKKKTTIPCEKCGVSCERFREHSIRTVCDPCQSKGQLEKRKREYTPKLRKIICVKCKICGSVTEQKTAKPKSFCSKACQLNSRYHRGVDNIERKCRICDKHFLINRYSKTQTCSDLCRGKYISSRMVQGG